MTQKLVTVEQVEGEGLVALMGQRVILMCMNYFYEGKLIGVNDDCVLLEEPGIIYETGPWNASTLKDLQKLHTKHWYVRINCIESFGLSK